MDFFAGLVVLGILAGFYFLPTIIAAVREVPNVWSIGVINAFLGWTVVGWVVALAMAARTVPPKTLAPLPLADKRECPNCKRTVRPDESACPHCGASLKPWTLHAGAWWVKSDSGEWQWRDESARTWRWYKDGMPSSPEATVRTPSLAINPAFVKPPDALPDARSDPPPDTRLSQSSSQADELERLATLHERGALTDEEFAAAKARLLQP